MSDTRLSPLVLVVLTTVFASVNASQKPSPYEGQNKQTARELTNHKLLVIKVWEDQYHTAIVCTSNPEDFAVRERAMASGGNACRDLFSFRSTHTDFRRALALKRGQELHIRYTPVDQDPKWTNGTNTMWTKYLRIGGRKPRRTSLAR
jgi:hypothetical protein